MHFKTHDSDSLAPFDVAWWEHHCRSSPLGPSVWLRWRLIDEILQRFYLDLGVQPIFGWMGSTDYQVAIASPCCARAPRFFGRLCNDGGIHESTTMDLEIFSIKSGELDLTQFRGPHATERESSYSWHPTHDLLGSMMEQWGSYLVRSLHTLHLPNAGVVGHDRCFHRRGRDLTPLMFRLALLLRIGEPTGLDTYDLHQRPFTHVSSAMVKANEGDEATSHAAEILSRENEAIPPGAPRWLTVSTGRKLLILRNDGLVLSDSGRTDVAELWRYGDPLRYIATQLAS